MSARFIEIFKGARKPEAYLYVDKADSVTAVPDELLRQLGELQSVMTMLLEPGRKLARANAAAVLASIDKQGYYLQMPPTPAELLAREGGGG